MYPVLTFRTFSCFPLKDSASFEAFAVDRTNLGESQLCGGCYPRTFAVELCAGSGIDEIPPLAAGIKLVGCTSFGSFAFQSCQGVVVCTVPIQDPILIRWWLALLLIRTVLKLPSAHCRSINIDVDVKEVDLWTYYCNNWAAAGDVLRSPGQCVESIVCNCE